MKKVIAMALGLAVLLSLAGCDVSGVSEEKKTSETIHASCVWTVWDHNIESFVINLADKNVLWIEEEAVLDISELTDGYIKFSGTKTKMQGQASRSLENVLVNFKINRVSGRFDAVAQSQFATTDRVGSCDFSDAQF